jgi:hypothetical protein
MDTTFGIYKTLSVPPVIDLAMGQPHRLDPDWHIKRRFDDLLRSRRAAAIEREEEIAAERQLLAAQGEALGGGKRKRDGRSAVISRQSDSDDLSDFSASSSSKRQKTSGKHNEKAVPSNVHLQMNFGHHPHEYTDDQYEDAFINLDSLVVNFSRKFFGVKYNIRGMLLENDSKDTPVRTERARLQHALLWQSFSPELMNYIELVAIGDCGTKSDRNWDSLLTNSEEREWLIAAIVNKIIEVKIFSQLLWGATEDQLRALDGADKSLWQAEGG